MSDPMKAGPSAPPQVRADVDRSRDDLAAGRVQPLRSVLVAIHRRASRRLEERLERGERDKGSAGTG